MHVSTNVFFLQSVGANYSPDLILLLIFAANSNEALLRGTIEHSGVVCCRLAEFLYLNWLKGFIAPECGARSGGLGRECIKGEVIF